MKKVNIWLIVVFLLTLTNLLLAANDYETLRKFLSARMYGEAYNELLRQELSGNGLDPKLKALKKDLLDRTNEKLQKQAKTTPNNAGLFTILADIAFQKGDYDRASLYASTALNNNGGAMASYIFSKILFRKGNVSQAFDQMSKVLESMPDSPIIFNDFQFLYTCQQYGVETAKKLSKDSSFLVRATPIAYDGEDLDAPESPFANDPTEMAESNDFSDYNVVANKKTASVYDLDDEDTSSIDEDLAELSKVDSSEKAEKIEQPSETKVAQKVETKEKEEPLPDEVDDLDELFSDGDEFITDETETETDTEKEEVEAAKKEETSSEKESDFVDKEEAQKLLATVKRDFAVGSRDKLELAWANVRKLNEKYPEIKEGKDLEDKIKYGRTVFKRYDEAKTLVDEGDFEKALKYFKEAYNYSPKHFSEAPYQIARCYLLKEDPDLDQALKYFAIIENDPSLPSELRQTILWTKLEIYLEKEDYDAADEVYSYLKVNEREFFKSQSNSYNIYISILWGKFKYWFIGGFSFLLLLVLSVFILQYTPDLAHIGGDPLVNAQKALDIGNYLKAVKLGEKAIAKQQPIQRDRQIREVLIQAYYELGEYEKVQHNAKIVLKGFPENAIAWGYLAKASVAIKDTSNEAIEMYEDMYRKDPSKREILPILAHNYAVSGDTSPFAMEILTDYHNDAPQDEETIIALANGYLQNRTMNEEVVPILFDAIKLKDKLEYHEFMARTLSKLGRYEDAANECVNVLNRNINDIGIHVVYTSSMKKLKRVSHAIQQYKLFINDHPGNTQLVEIMNGLVSEMGENAPDTFMDSAQQFSESLGMPGMGDDYSNDAEVANFVEPIPEEIAEKETNSVPTPDFMNENKADLPEGISTLDPFADVDSLLDGFDTDELPEELGGTARVPTSSSESLDSLIDGFNNTEIKRAAPETAPSTGVLELGGKIEQAREFASSGEWDDVINLLSPEFASNRNKEAGTVLVDAWLAKGKPETALEIIQALDIDPEMMTIDIKNVMYKVADALENTKKYKEALKLFDTICNADINFKDAFDRSDRLYTKMKSS